VTPPAIAALKTTTKWNCKRLILIAEKIAGEPTFSIAGNLET
jgi:hypothetical protein